jgi:hypothetical protein
VKDEKPAVKKGGLVAGQRVLGSTKVRVALWEALAFPFSMHSSSLFRWDTAALFASRLSPRRVRVTRRLRLVSSPPSSFPPCSSASSQSHPPQLLPSSSCTTFVHRPHCHLHQRPFSATDSDLLNDDADLTASLARARRVAQKTQALLATAEGDEDALDTGASRINTLLKSDQAFQPKKVRCDDACVGCCASVWGVCVRGVVQAWGDFLCGLTLRVWQSSTPFL